MNSKSIAIQLGEKGVCICPHFLSPKRLREVQSDLDPLLLAGEFHRAGVGRGEQKSTSDEIRKDEVRWLDRTAQNPAQAHLWRRIDLLRLVFNRVLFLGLKDFEGHYAVYPPGGHYSRHLDQFQSHNARTVSFILYLNRDWQSEDGGQLRIYGPSQTVDVDPIGGTMVCFMSADMEHEVLLSNAPRKSLAGWFRR